MSERIKQLIGDENYKKITELLGDKIKVEDIDIIPDNYVTLSKFNKTNGEKKNIQSQYEAEKKHNEKVKSIVKKANKENIDEVLADYENELTTNKTNNKKLKADLVNMKKENYVQGYFRENKVEEKNIKLLIKSIDFDKITVGDDEEVIGVKEQVDGFKKDYPNMFPTTNKNSANTNNQNTNNSGSNNDGSGTGGEGEDIYDKLLEDYSTSF